MKAFTPIVLALLLTAGRLTADSLLDQAREKEKAGDAEASASLRASWLSANPGAAGSASVFADYLRVEQDFGLLLDRSTLFLKTSAGVPGASAQLQTVARLFDLAGRIEEARDAYMAARREGAPDSTLVSAFLLSLRMNDADSMSSTLQQMAGSSASARILLKALSDLRAGDAASARTALVGLSDQTGDPDLALKAIWILYECASDGGDAAGQAAAREKMRKRFPLAPETALAGAGDGTPGASVRRSVVGAPAPGFLDPGVQPPSVSQPVASPSAPPAVAVPPESSPRPAGGPPVAEQPGSSQPSPPPAPSAVPPAVPAGMSPAAPAPSAPVDAGVTAPPAGAAAPAAPTYSVQAGSFGMKENADDLVGELAKRGFSASILRDVSQGKERFRVFAATGADVDGAKIVLEKLVAAGFSGFLVRDR